KIQFTNVRPDATRSEIITHLERSMEYGFQAAMISMCWVPLAREVLRGSGVRIATCIGLGMGHESLHAKIALLRECYAMGANEVDYELNIDYCLTGMYTEFEEDAAAQVRADEGMPLKIMLELGYIQDDDQRRLAVRLLDEAGVPWIKKSSWVGPGSEP